MGAEGDAFEHRTRKQIYNYINSNPGASFGLIRNFLELNESTLTYHLTYLERSRKISSRKEGRRRCYYCNDRYDFDHDAPLYPVLGMLNKNQQRILRTIKDIPGITKKELAIRTKMKRTTLDYNIDKLTELKLIWKVKSGGKIGYEYITKDKLRSEIYHRLLLRLMADEIDEETFLKIKRKLEELDLEEQKV